MNVADLVIDELARQGVQATRLSADSRVTAPGDVFVALPGHRVDGHDFIAAALARGAAAVIHERREIGDIAVPHVGVDNLVALSGEIAHRVYGRPSEKLWLAGVTGTNGKTSVSQWIAQAMAALGRRCAVIGTLGNGFPGELADTRNTTPDAITLHSLLAGYVAQGAQACAMEVSSIGLDQGRSNGAQFAVAVFTNLTRDHLDYHGDMDSYAAAKAKLFATPGLGAAVLNLDDPCGAELARQLAGRVPTFGYTLADATGAAGAVGVDHVLAAQQLEMTARGLRFTLAGQRVEAPLLGRFNATNVLAVIGALMAGGNKLDDIIPALAALVPPPGRMQTLGGVDAPLVVIDYAHTPDALENVLSALRPTAQTRSGKLVCLFGCGGDRDPGKRPLMGALAQRLADRVVLSSDNPRSESPRAIIDDILSGMQPGAQVTLDRAQAIADTLHDADARDVILLAGKGHETYQEIAGQRLPFDDVAVARSALEQRR